MSHLFLIGRHGAGKSTIGAELAKRGYKHISVGLLRRLARANQLPSDFPYALMAAMRRTQPGEALPDDVARKLVAYALQFNRFVLDGFPVSVDHLDLLPPAALIGVVCAPSVARNDRLQARAENSQRAWIAGRRSAREESLAAVIATARRKFRTIYIPNKDSVAETVDHLWGGLD
jgi:cytidylate kinase